MGILASSKEDDVENRLLLPLFEQILSYSSEKQQSLDLTGLSKEEQKRVKKPDLVLFSNAEKRNAALQLAAISKKAVCAQAFCAEADFIVDAKKFSKGIGADEETGLPKEGSAAQDIEQVSRYLKGCGKKWGVLTNGRCWRLMRQGEPQAHLRFDLILFLENIISREKISSKTTLIPEIITGEDLDTFNLFWHLFGPPAVSGGYLDLLLSESEANTRRVRDILRQNAHRAVQEIAHGFWIHPNNGFASTPKQVELDHLRELALIFLYRLLFVLKAEAQGLLRLKDEIGRDTLYAITLATKVIFDRIDHFPESSRNQVSTGFDDLKKLFAAVNAGENQYDVPAYNGGLFDPETNPELERLKLNDDVIHSVLKQLIYLDGNQPVPYADLDVRDFGDIYEGLLEQRLVWEETGPSGSTLSLRNKKGERKASGSYFTPDSLVDHIVRATLQPLLDQCGNDAQKILALKVLDPSMGSGHFLVKVVDVIAWHLTLNCKGSPDDNGPREYAFWKRQVVENCIYGIDYNPMAVELAKVALWLHTANFGEPLSFLDHHLKCGNSLVGASLKDIAQPALISKATKTGTAWIIAGSTPQPKTSLKKKASKKTTRQLLLPFPIDTSLFAGILKSVQHILHGPSKTPQDIKSKRKQYGDAVNTRLKAHRALCDLWCAQWFLPEPDEDSAAVYESSGGLYVRIKKICGIPNDAERDAELTKALQHPFMRQLDITREAGYGPKPGRFFHWQLEFPEVAFTEQGELKDHFGFDAIVGNPPWDKIKPAKRDFYSPFNEEVANRQGLSLDALIQEMETKQPELIQGWQNYESTLKQLLWFLENSDIYKHQTAIVEGKKTGGDPDVFKYFVERAWQGVGNKGRLGLVLPATIWQGQGCTGLRRLLFTEATLESLYTFENYRKWAFDIDSRFKFTAFIATQSKPKTGHSFPAAFMLRDTQVLEGKMQDRIIVLSRDLITATSPESLALIDNRSDLEVNLIKRLHKTLPALGSANSGWNVIYRTELHMTNDAWLFKTRDWMKKRGFTRIWPEKSADGTWTQKRESIAANTINLPDNLPAGGEYWVAADELWYKARGYTELEQFQGGKTSTIFYHPEDVPGKDAKGNDPNRILTGEIYTPLYEGRMVHIFDHCQKAYIAGEGRKAIWEDISITEKILKPRTFVSITETSKQIFPRIGFCDITGATNERSILASILQRSCILGHKVPSLISENTHKSLLLTTVMNSFCADFIIRQKISTNLTWNFLSSLPVPSYTEASLHSTKLQYFGLKLNCTTPELAEVWNEIFPDNPWTYASAERDLWKRAELRAEIDAIIAELYGLTVEEYAMVLTGFPLLDRDQPALEGDAFLTEGDEKSKRKGKEEQNWIEREWGIMEIKPRSFITRDYALLTYMRRKKYALPQDLKAWYKDKVGLDPDGPLSRFMIGTTVDLEERVVSAKAKGAIPYVPTSRGE